MKTIKNTFIDLAISAGLALATGSAFAQTYTAADVDPTQQTYASAINDRGYVGGRTFRSYDYRASYRASYNNVGLGVERHISDERSSTSESNILDLNKGALGVGYTTSRSGLDVTTMATLFTYDQRTIPIGGLPGDTYSSANAVNDTGWVVGVSRNNERPFRAFLWVPDGGDVTRPGSMYPLPCSGEFSFANTVNKNGWIGGQCGEKPYLWAYGRGQDISGWLPARVDLGHGLVDRESVNLTCNVSSIANSQAFSVNCFILTADINSQISFVSTPASPTLTQVPGLGLFDGLSSQVQISAINDDGCAVGHAADPTRVGRPHATDTAVKYCNGVLTDLNNVSMPGTPDLYAAKDINNFGEILATAYSSGDPNTHPVVLSPH